MTWVVDTDENGKQKLKSEDDLRRERQEEQELKRNKDSLVPSVIWTVIGFIILFGMLILIVKFY